MLTEKRIRDAKPGTAPYVLWDAQIKGLGCRVFPTGGKRYVLSYRIGPAKRFATIARCETLSLRKARDLARAELAQARLGAVGALERRRLAREGPTVRVAAVEAWLAHRVRSADAAHVLVTGAFEEARERWERAQANGPSSPLPPDLGFDLDDSTVRQNIVSGHAQLRGVFPFTPD